MIDENQKEVNTKLKNIDQVVGGQYNKLVEKQKIGAGQVESFAKTKDISQSLARCNQLLNESIENFEILNNMLPLEHRLEPYVWETSSTS